MHVMRSLALLAALVPGIAAADQDELVPVTIVLREQASFLQQDAWRRMSDPVARRRVVIDELQSLSAESAGPLLAMLAGEQANGQVGPRIRPLWIANVVATQATPDAMERIAARPDVAGVYLDWRPKPELSPPPLRDDETAGGAAAGGGPPLECGVELMEAPAVWDMGITGAGVVVAVIDSGACIAHPDLAGQVWTNAGEIPGNGADDDSNGFADDVNGWNFEDGNGDVSDFDNHGTHVSGTVVGDGTLGTMTGMAPDAQLMSVRISHELQSEVWAAIEYAVDNDAHVINGSLGWFQSVAERAAWRMACENAMAAGAVLVFSAGNSAQFQDPPTEVGTPGDVPDVITVGATDCSDQIVIFSSRGPVTWQDVRPYFDWPFPPGKMKPTVTAPGLNTWSTSRFSACTDYALNSGTSMSAPHVAGTVALLLQASPGMDQLEVLDALTATAVDLGAPGHDNDYGAGRVNALEAVLAVMGPNADLNGDGTVDVLDMIQLILAWGPCPPPPPDCPADLDGNGGVDVLDLIELILAWS